GQRGRGYSERLQDRPAPAARQQVVEAVARRVGGVAREHASPRETRREPRVDGPAAEAARAHPGTVRIDAGENPLDLRRRRERAHEEALGHERGTTSRRTLVLPGEGR